MSNRYTVSFLAANGNYVTQQFSSKARALKAAAIIVETLKDTNAPRKYARVATPAGNLVTYVGLDL